jgi:putative FmdB family regulatory protein
MTSSMPNARSRWPETRLRLLQRSNTVPIYEYVCRKCEKQFEELVFGASQPVCPACQSPEVERILSSVSVGRAQSESAPSACDSCCSRGRPGCGMN